MPSLSLVKDEASHREGSGGYCLLMDGDVRICRVEEWAFYSCAVFALDRLGLNASWWTKANIDRFVAFLKTMNCYSTYCAQEAYMLVSSTQLKYYMPQLKEHPNIKEVDSFLNKAHGPNSMHLFRISVAKDFK